MPVNDPKDPVEKGEVEVSGERCDVCGNRGETVIVPGRPPPNRFCLKCAVEYGDQVAGDDDY